MITEGTFNPQQTGKYPMLLCDFFFSLWWQPCAFSRNSMRGMTWERGSETPIEIIGFSADATSTNLCGALFLSPHHQQADRITRQARITRQTDLPIPRTDTQTLFSDWLILWICSLWRTCINSSIEDHDRPHLFRDLVGRGLAPRHKGCASGEVRPRIFIRGDVGPSCWVIKPLGHKLCEVEWLLNTKINGWIPLKAVESTLSSVMVETIAHLRNHCASVSAESSANQFQRLTESAHGPFKFTFCYERIGMYAGKF
ncbi:unnamed protein product [Nesidiocoris tenuis]|uniref:START domain-containing protein n=1 Tax=Nesidiocoris tenuis TaxID=355587 RepID=A0A6H5HF62_9HEMI|nr:unnamed protein product [Nesidiocoris tenuis]